MISSSMISGCVGGVVGCAAGYPFDTVKTLMQCDPAQYPSATVAARRVAVEQGLRGFFRGATVPLCGLGAIYAVGFLAYDAAARAVTWARSSPAPIDIDARPSVARYRRVLADAVVCGAFSGMCMSVLMSPSELVKIRQQATLRSSGASAVDASLRATLRRLYAENGRRGLMNFTTGLPATLARDVPGSAVWFATYEGVRLACSADPAHPRPWESWVAGGCAGVATWVLVLPVDVAKTVQQSAVVSAGAAGTTQLSLRDAAERVWRTEGLRGFYAGVRPVVVRAFVANGAMFAARDFMSRHLP